VVVERGGDHQPQHRVTQELQPFVGGQTTVLVGVRTVGQRPAQELRVEGHPQRGLEYSLRRTTHDGAVPQSRAISCRPLYVPHTWQTACGSFGSRHCGHGSVRTGRVFHCARRDRVLLRDILRLGTATVLYSSVRFSCLSASQRGSTRSSWRWSTGRSSQCAPHPGHRPGQSSRHSGLVGSASTTASRTVGSRSIRSPCNRPTSSSSAVTSVVLSGYANSSWIATSSGRLIGRRQREHS